MNDTTTATTVASAGGVSAKAYFEEPRTKMERESIAISVTPLEAQLRATTGVSEVVEPYRQSAHKVILKRYAIRRG